jgi:hypothetical protein
MVYHKQKRTDISNMVSHLHINRQRWEKLPYIQFALTCTLFKASNIHPDEFVIHPKMAGFSTSNFETIKEILG